MRQENFHFITKMKIFVFDWRVIDNNAARSNVIGFGKTSSGKLIGISIPFSPSFYIRATNPHVAKADVCEKFRDDIASISIVRKVPHIGFRNNVAESVVHVSFKNLAAFRRCIYFCRDKRYPTCESKKEAVIDFFHQTGINPCGWVDISDDAMISVTGDDKMTSSSVNEYKIALGDIHASSSTEKPPLILCSWDIECISRSGGFPDGAKEADVVITIGAIYQDFASGEIVKRSAHQLRSCDTVDGIDVTSYAEESELISSFFAEVDEMQTDVMVGYNVFGFDWKYLANRMTVLLDWDTGDSVVNATPLGRLADMEQNGKEVRKNLSSGAFGDNEMVFLNTPGRINLDLMHIVKKDMKLESYSLNNVAKSVLGDRQKIDLPPKKIFEYFDIDARHRAQIAEYCVRDCELPLEIMGKIHTVMGLIEMSNATCVCLEYLQLRGQQIRVYSLLTRKSRDLGYIVQDTKNDEGFDDGKYQGATVLDPKIGSYTDESDIVSALDFASLYPSIMRAHTLCASTMVLDDRYANVDGVEYYDIAANGKQLRFAQTKNAPIPLLLEDLSEFRKSAKRDMKLSSDAGDSFMESLYNQRQLSYKICMNSVYGSLGVSRGILTGLKDISAAVTATGRQMIETTKQKVMELNPGSNVIYGDTDSVLCILKLPTPEEQRDIMAHAKLAEDIATKITEILPKPNILEFEKLYSPYLLFQKKRYAGICFPEPVQPGKFKVDIKGLSLIRRDSAPISRHISKIALDTILFEKSFESALEKVRAEILAVLEFTPESDWGPYVMSKSLRASYKNPESLPHYQVAKKRRAEGQVVNVGERIPFVYVKENMDLLQSHRAEDPDMAKNSGKELDILYYINNQITNPLISLFELKYGKDARAMIFGDQRITEKLMSLQANSLALVREHKRVRMLKNTNQAEITQFFAKRQKTT